MPQNLLGITSMLPKVLCSMQLSATTATTVYTVPAGSSAIVKHGVACNTGTASCNVTVSVVPSGGTADATHRVLSAFPLGAGDSLSLADYLGEANLGPGDFISAQASIAAVLDVILTGVESV